MQNDGAQLNKFDTGLEARVLAVGALYTATYTFELTGSAYMSSSLYVGGQLTLTDGTAAAPSLRVGNEQNGLYSPAANKLGVATGGVERVTIDSNGGVAIANPTSGDSLIIGGTTQLRLKDTAGNNRGRLYWNASVMGLYNDDNTPLRLGTEGTTRLELGGTGNVTVASGNQLIVPDGTASAPSLKVGDEQNGLYSSASNELSVALGGAQYYTLTGNSYSTVLGVGSVPSAWSNTVLPTQAVEIGDRGSAAQYSGSFYLNWNAKINSSYNEVARTSSGTPASLQIGGGAITFKAAASNPGAGSAITFTNLLTARGNSDMDVSLDCGRLKFPATQNASSNANTLDDYEEGSWTPTTSTTNCSISTISYATYQKVGKWVKLYCYISINNTGGARPDIVIGGLPFTAAASYFLVTPHYAANGANDCSVTYSYVDASNTTFRVGFATNAINNGLYGYMFSVIMEATA